MANQKINLDLSFLRPWQTQFVQNMKKFNVLVLHRRAWKTIVAIVVLLFKALTNKGTYGYIAPFRSQAKTIGWDILNKVASQIPWVVFNVSELKCTLPNGSVITLFGADNKEALRGLDLKGVVLDEYADMDKGLYSEVLFPMLNAHLDSFTLWIGTPKGYNIFYDLYIKATTHPKYYTMLATVYDTGLLNEEQIEEAKEEMTTAQGDDSAFRQEFLLDWSVAVKYSYYWEEIEKVKKDGRLADNVFNQSLPVYTAWDLGVADATCIIFFQWDWEWIRVIDYYENTNKGLPFYVEILELKGYRYKEHFMPFDIKVKEWGSWLTRIEQAKEKLGDDKVVAVKRIGVQDWITAARTLFPKMVFDSTLEIPYLNRLSLFQPKIDKDWNPTDKAEHCDIADTIRYLAMSYNQFIEPEDSYGITYINYDDLLE
jgi:phage terminase large subunit